jgi:hypothetical protein
MHARRGPELHRDKKSKTEKRAVEPPADLATAFGGGRRGFCGERGFG